MSETRLWYIEATAGGSVRLGVREKRPAGVRHSGPPILLVHGATLGGALFDLPRPGYSLMGSLARSGHPVYALDIRGYGTSVDAAAMNGPAEDHPPFAAAEEAVQDIAAAVAFIRARDNAGAVDLVGFSWGTVTAARYAGLHPRTVRRLALYAPLYAEMNPLWLGRIADPRDTRRLAPGLGAYRWVTAVSLVERWNGDLPSGDPSEFREDGIADLVFETVARLDPQAAARHPRAFRCPNGALADMVRIFNGEPLYDAARLTMPLLAVRGAHDTTATDSDARRLLAASAAAQKQYRVIDPGSHFLCIERHRERLYDELVEFLESD